MNQPGDIFGNDELFGSTSTAANAEAAGEGNAPSATDIDWPGSNDESFVSFDDEMLKEVQSSGKAVGTVVEGFRVLRIAERLE